MRERVGGYTEEEKLALAWSKRNKEADLINAKRPTSSSSSQYAAESRSHRNDTIRNDRDDRNISNDDRRDRKDRKDKQDRKYRKDRERSPERPRHSSERSRISLRRIGEKRSNERDSPNYNIGSYEKHIDGDDSREGKSERNGRNRGDVVKSKGGERGLADEWARSHSRERGRDRSKDRTSDRNSDRSRERNEKDKKHDNKEGLRKNRDNGAQSSRNRSDSRSRSRSRSRSGGRQNKYRADSRSRSRSPLPPTWAHDLFSTVVTDSPVKNKMRDDDYRPPSPTWVSRAGGVAIMRKKS